MAQTSQQALAGRTPAQEVLPIVGTAVGDIFGPFGGMAGREIGTGIGNTIATGDVAGAASGTPASWETNFGGLFQGQGLEGFWRNFLLPQMMGGPGAGPGGGSMGMLRGIQHMRGGIGGPQYGQGYRGPPQASGIGGLLGGGGLGSLFGSPGMQGMSGNLIYALISGLLSGG
jgi:hypothetical protein